MTSRLASLLVQDGRVSARKMADAFQRQVIFGGTLDTILLEMGAVDEGVLLDYLGRAANMPALDDAGADSPPPEVLARFPVELAQQFRAAPLAREGAALRVLVVDPPDREALVRLGAAVGIAVDPAVVAEYRFHQRLERVYGVPLPERYATLAAKMQARPRATPPARRAEHTPTIRFAPILDAPIAPAPVEPPVARPTPAPPVAEPELRWPSEDYVVAQQAPLPRADELGEVLPTASSMEVTAAEIETPLAEPAPEPPPAEEPVRADETFGEAPPAAFAPAIDDEPQTPAPRLSLAEGLAALQTAADRDAVFEALCLIARDRFDFVALFTVQGDVATARMALGADWFDRNALVGVSVHLAAPSALRAAVQSSAPFIGRVGDDPALGGILRFLDRRAPLPAALVPLALRGRVVAVLYVDSDAREVAADELAHLAQAAAEASKAFLRLIKSKKGATSQPRLPVPPEPQPEPAPAPVTTAPPVATLAGLGGLADAALLASAQAAAFAPTLAALGGNHAASVAAPPPAGAIDPATLVDAVVRDDGNAPGAVAALLMNGAAGASAVLARFPGPLRFGHRKLHTVGLPLAEHGPLVALAARFGALAVPLLLARLDDPAPDARYYAALVLGELRAEAAVVPLGHRLFDPDTAVRRAAAHALGRYAPSPTLRALLDGLRNELVSPDLARQRHATVALGELRDATSVPRLVDLLKHRDMEIVDLAHRALVIVTKQDFGTTRWRWRSWWEKNREQSRLDWLLGGLEQPSPEARRSAAEELAAIATDRFGFHATFPRREREDAARRFTAWFQRNPGALAEERSLP